jgi:glycosyltransferase involved in cell wall biosynthesis
MAYKFNILFVSNTDPEEGAPHHAMAGIWLASRGWPVHLLTAGCANRLFINTPLGRIPASGIPKQVGWLGKIGWQLHMFWRILQVRFKGQTDVYYIEGSPVTPVALPALLFVPSRKIIYHTQDYLEPARYWLRAAIEKAFARRAGLVICNEPARARFMASHYSLSQLPMVVRTTLPAAWPTPDRDPAIRKDLLSSLGLEDLPKWKLVLHTGAYSEERCSDALLRALACLPHDYVVVFIGVVPNSHAEQLTRNAGQNLGLHKRIIFVNRMPFNEILRIAASCDVGILLYPDDTLGDFFAAPGKLTEYIGCGIPIIASHFPGLELTILKYDLGKVCDPQDPSSIAEALQLLGARNKQRQDSERVRLKNIAKTELSYDSMAGKIERYLLSLGHDE